MHKLFGKNAEILYICLKYFVVRWFRIILFLLVLLVSGYVWFMNSLDKNQKFVMEREIGYPVERIFPQFENFQNFTRWNQFLLEKKYNYQYFQPYVGEGSAMSFRNTKQKDDYGEIFIRYVNPNSTIKYHFYWADDTLPYKMNIKFIPKGDKTKLVWSVETPEIPLMMRYKSLNAEDNITERVNLSLKNLENLLAGKVYKEIMLSEIKYDSIMVEEQGERLLLGLNVTAVNQKGILFKNIVTNHNKLMNFVTKDLSKREDEFGMPVLLMEEGNLRNKEISYFYGIPLSKEEKIMDNNFVFRKLNKSKKYSIYYKGQYEQRIRTIAKLKDKIRKDSLRNGTLEELFVETPSEGREVLLKLSFPVFK